MPFIKQVKKHVCKLPKIVNARGKIIRALGTQWYCGHCGELYELTTKPSASGSLLDLTYWCDTGTKIDNPSKEIPGE